MKKEKNQKKNLEQQVSGVSVDSKLNKNHAAPVLSIKKPKKKRIFKISTKHH